MIIKEIEITFKKNLNDDEKNSVLKLLGLVFNLTTFPIIDYNFIVTIDKSIIGYAAVNTRCIEINNKPILVNLLGLVSIHTDYRNKGYGSDLIKYIQKSIIMENNNGLLLNCGRNIEDFYVRNGFKKIANNAEYNRNGIIVQDNDPVYYYGNKLSESICVETIYIGSDF